MHLWYWPQWVVHRQVEVAKKKMYILCAHHSGTPVTELSECWKTTTKLGPQCRLTTHGESTQPGRWPARTPASVINAHCNDAINFWIPASTTTKVCISLMPWSPLICPSASMKFKMHTCTNSWTMTAALSQWNQLLGIYLNSSQSTYFLDPRIIADLPLQRSSRHKPASTVKL